MNPQTAVGPVVDVKVAVQRLDAIAKSVESCFRGLPDDREREFQRAIRFEHLHRRPGPT